eukprot:14107565-Ditylum_brightwellii.AAC.1
MEIPFGVMEKDESISFGKHIQKSFRMVISNQGNGCSIWDQKDNGIKEKKKVDDMESHGQKG